MDGPAVKKVAIIGAGVSGLTCAQLLKDRYDVTVFEKERTPGGLIRCERVNGSLFHICGGHVFNTKNQAVRDWFWSKFNRDEQFVKADRKSAVCMEDGRFVDYPIENHVYQMDESVQKSFIGDLVAMKANPPRTPENFDDFLRSRFGETLYNLYFRPYNEKVWRRDLREVPLDWLAGKLPMPTVEEMFLANMSHVEEKTFVHSSFYYEKEGGSQFIADTLAKDVTVVYGADIDDLAVGGYDKVVFCGNIKDLPRMAKSIDLGSYGDEIEKLEYHGTTAVFCEFDKNPYSWFYQPSKTHQSHRFICTGNFSPTNNAPGKMSGTVEFTDEIGIREIKAQLERMPYHPQYLTHRYHKYTYPIQHKNTRAMIQGVKDLLAAHDVYLCGRFAEWEYFNMDAAMASAMKVCEELHD